MTLQSVSADESGSSEDLAGKSGEHGRSIALSSDALHTVAGATTQMTSQV
jgi:hypothetical protein